MRLTYPGLNIEFNLSETEPVVIVLEKPEIFSDFIENIWNQTNGREGCFILGNADKVLCLDKKLALIMNPFAISSNDRKILSKIYTELSIVTTESYYEELAALNTAIINALDKMMEKLPYPLTSKFELDLISLFKTYDIKIEEEDNGLLERVVSYLKLNHQVCGIEVFVFVNLKQYLEKEQLQELYKAAAYEQVYIINIEGRDGKERLKEERCIIIDKDLCIIDLM